MWTMLQQDRPDDYIIATGTSHTLADFLEQAFAVIGIADWHAYVKHNDALARPAEVLGLVGDCSKAQAELGFRSTVAFEDIVRRMVESDLRRTSSN